MPHKHKRLKTSSEARYELPPTAAAKGLPVKHASVNGKDGKRNGSKKSEKPYHDDTPRAFAQLMRLRNIGKGYNGLDNGQSQQPKPMEKKRKRDANTLSEAASNGEGVADSSSSSTTNNTNTNTALKIQPGERLTDYAARVDRALPVAGLIAKHNKVDGAREQRKTKHEKKLQRLVNNWKTEEAKRLERAQDEWDDAEDEEDERATMWEEARQAAATGRKKGRRKAEEDPWEELKKKRDRPKGVFDVVQAPPQFTKVPREFKVRNSAKVKVDNVPNAGSLRRQEMLSETRQEVINRYRQMMQAKRGEP